MKKCKDCTYNKKDEDEYFCLKQGIVTTWLQDRCDNCEDFVPSYKKNLKRGKK